MTKKLYEENVYLKEASCKIIKRINDEDKKVLVLDQTLFFPEGGGQKFDLGTIDGCQVLNVYIKDKVIYHVMDRFPESDEVKCILDWERRFDHMQQHCGEHILSGVFLTHYNLRNKGFHLGEDYLTVDMDVKELSPEQIEKVELLANQAIWENHDIDINTVMTTDEANAFPLRKIPDVTEDIRIVQINNVDTVACCGTHPLTSGEVGIIKILKWQKNKGMTRVFFKCGGRAFKDYQSKHNLISELNIKFSADINTLKDKIEIEGKKKKAIMDEVFMLRKQMSEKEAISLMSQSDNKVITHLYEDLSIEMLQFIAQSIHNSNESYMLMLGSVSNGTIVLSHDGSVDINCGNLVRENIPKESARGGGGKAKAQVVFSEASVLREFFDKVTRSLNVT